VPAVGLGNSFPKHGPSFRGRERSERSAGIHNHRPCSCDESGCIAAVTHTTRWAYGSRAHGKSAGPICPAPRDDVGAPCQVPLSLLIETAARSFELAMAARPEQGRQWYAINRLEFAVEVKRASTALPSAPLAGAAASGAADSSAARLRRRPSFGRAPQACTEERQVV
jgi:hypothetical protein